MAFTGTFSGPFSFHEIFHYIFAHLGLYFEDNFNNNYSGKKLKVSTLVYHASTAEEFPVLARYWRKHGLIWSIGPGLFSASTALTLSPLPTVQYRHWSFFTIGAILFRL